MIHVQHSVPDTPMKLLAPSDPSHPWLVKLPTAKGIGWKVTPSGCELELSPAYAAALGWSLMEHTPVPTTSSIDTAMGVLVAMPLPPVPSMDAPPPLPFVVDVAEPVVVGARTTTEEPEQEVNASPK